MMANALGKEAVRIAAAIRTWRRHLHAQPELSGRERQTARYIAEQLSAMGYQPRVGVGHPNGITADLPVVGERMIALRADTDALPITEQTGVDYASRNAGVMHACGHDAHVAMLLGAARLLREHQARLKGAVRFIFQPQEELFPGGAAPMIDAGALDGIAEIFGIHVCTNLEHGQLGIRAGAFMAAVNTFEIIVRGRGGHAAMPEYCVDPVVTAAEIVLALQTVVSRRIPVGEPAVVSVTRLQAGTADNVIPNEARLCGTIRTFDETRRQQICEHIREIAEGVAGAHRAQAEVTLCDGYPVLVNNPDVLDRVRRSAELIGFTNEQFIPLAPQGGGEDFAYYCQRVPGAFVFLGAANAIKDCSYPHHHPRFNIDEDVLPIGAALYAQFACKAS